MDYERLINTRLFLLDMDGTLYLGDDVFDGAVDFIHSISETYLTNNSSRAGVDYITRLRRLGFPCEAENVFTSGMATGEFLNQNYPGAKVYLAGTKAFYRELQSYGIDLVNDENGHTDVDTVDVVVQGFDTELVYEKLDLACHFLRRGAKFIAANPDWVCPMPADEVLPDCGSICGACLSACSPARAASRTSPRARSSPTTSSRTSPRSPRSSARRRKNKNRHFRRGGACPSRRTGTKQSNKVRRIRSLYEFASHFLFLKTICAGGASPSPTVR